jgi:CheY-like chemotaxis protein
MTVSCLLVDDNQAYLTLARDLLVGQGVEVLGTARSGVEALRLADELAPDVVVLDVQLGDESGIDVARALAAAGGPPVVLISTHAEDDLRELIGDSPVLGFVPKRRLAAAAITSLLQASR